MGDIAGGECTLLCNNNICGDGHVYIAEEECDDNNQIDDDLCTNNCTNPVCGDGIQQSSEEEECDDGNQ